jgi:hypothetical protein
MKHGLPWMLLLMSLVLVDCAGGSLFGYEATLGGQVSLRDGTPLEGVEITFYFPDAINPDYDPPVVTTDEDGWYSYDCYYLNEKDDTIIEPSHSSYLFSPASYLIRHYDGDHLDLDFTAIPTG